MKNIIYILALTLMVLIQNVYGEDLKPGTKEYEQKLKEVSLLKNTFDNLSGLKKQLELLEQNTKKDPSKRGSNLALAGDLAGYAIGHIRSADKNLWKDPSPERLKRIQEIQEIIEPYKSLLIYLSEPTKTEQGNLNALGFLHYAKPDEYLQKELRRIANLPNPRGAASKAYFVLINLGLDSPEIREEIVNRISNFKSHSETPEDSEVFYGTRNYQLKEAIPAYLKQLQLPQATNYIYDGRVRLIAEAVENMGSDAVVLLPELKRHLVLMKERNINFMEINSIERTIYKIENNITVPSLAMNGSGPLKRYEEKTLDISSTNAAGFSSQKTNLIQSATNQTAKENIISEKSQEKENAHWLKWVLGSIGLVLIIGLLVQFLKRRR